MQHPAPFACAPRPESMGLRILGRVVVAERAVQRPIHLDLRGIPCPIAWARAKVFIEGLRTGAVVQVVIDDDRSARDLPAAAEAEGYAVIGTEPVGTAGAVAITIER